MPQPPKQASRLTDHQWGEARRLYESTTASNQAIGDQFGVSRETIRKRAAREGWERSTEAARAAERDRRARTAEARAAADVAWSGTRIQAANQLGSAGSLALRQVIGELVDANGQPLPLGSEECDAYRLSALTLSVQRLYRTAEHVSAGAPDSARSAVIEWLEHISGEDE